MNFARDSGTLCETQIQAREYIDTCYCTMLVPGLEADLTGCTINKLTSAFHASVLL